MFLGYYEINNKDISWIFDPKQQNRTSNYLSVLGNLIIWAQIMYIK